MVSTCGTKIQVKKFDQTKSINHPSRFDDLRWAIAFTGDMSNSGLK
jgi:hypothetical protein